MFTPDEEPWITSLVTGQKAFYIVGMYRQCLLLLCSKIYETYVLIVFREKTESKGFLTGADRDLDKTFNPISFDGTIRLKFICLLIISVSSKQTK